MRFRDKLLIILSKNSMGSEWVGDDVEKALAEEKEQHTLRLFPIRLDGAVLKAKDNWAEKIRLRLKLYHCTASGIRVSVAIQLISQVSPSSVENACANLQEVGVISEITNLTRIGRPFLNSPVVGGPYLMKDA